MADTSQILSGAFAWMPSLTPKDIAYYITLLLFLVVMVLLGLRLIRFTHKVLIIDRRGIGRNDLGRKMKKDGTWRLSVLRSKANLTWPRFVIPLTKKKNQILLIEDDAGNLHNIRFNWDSQAITTEGDFVDLQDLYLKHGQGFAPLKKLKLVTRTGKEVVIKKFPLFQPADTNVMREFIQNNKETIQTYHKPSMMEKMAPYMAFATVVVVSAVYWFVVAKWH